eukprot:CAMPEP_0170136064 /NCGR_PEP_ID=MMETSP0033_2-20121228/2954_1 /TAXON_ID=195969 /ORGANISM="Dolichomastix tenuilepis, Strain CCMP3274" /LENGTH=298 /DNA_ID=CAMNT_0010371715 /DNA_START=57 /DNA_END=953 /DNA_ORIENTATION=-
MPILHDSDVKTREVLEWKGMTLLHFTGSSCSMKVRLVLAVKGIEYKAREINIPGDEHFKPWFLGINPRGLVPVLVHDGKVIIESNDIIAYLEEQVPTPSVMPASAMERIKSGLDAENDLHYEMRNISYRYLFPPGISKSRARLADYRKAHGSRTVSGAADPKQEIEIAWFEEYAKHGAPNAAILDACSKFKAALDAFEAALAGGESRFLAGTDEPSILDTAWAIYAHRLLKAGYPLAELHPRVAEWYAELLRLQPLVQAELDKSFPIPLIVISTLKAAYFALTGGSLKTIMAPLIPSN